MAFAQASGISDTSFQEVSGISSELDTEDVVEGGENRFVHRLPKGVKHPILSLKRGIASESSPLMKWCKRVLEGDLIAKIAPQLMIVYLMDAEKTPIRAWSFANAYPVSWEVEGFGSEKSEVAIEKINLSYNYSYRLI